MGPLLPREGRWGGSPRELRNAMSIGSKFLVLCHGVGRQQLSMASGGLGVGGQQCIYPQDGA